ncbi:MAG TPA: 16S rRNA (uracil(1498)-N(3))-methyltransferase [Nitrospira sp.]|nr:16S rRNA (uracil(1498)-N(3))-methyltransferase [Nitrospira sp.]
MPTFFVPSGAITPPIVRIESSLLRHLRDSLRLKTGEPLIVTDDRGLRHRTEIIKIGPQSLECRIVETTQAPARTSPSLILAQALLKGEKMDWVVQKATELGVDAIVPIQTKHAVVKIHADRTEHQRARWERIALEAAQQSERWTVPTIAAPVDVSKTTASYPSAVKLVLAERAGEGSLTTIALPKASEESIVLFIGPEGGWDGEELKLMQHQGCKAVTLGSRILRAETAALTALSIVQSRLGELG